MTSLHFIDTKGGDGMRLGKGMRSGGEGGADWRESGRARGSGGGGRGAAAAGGGGYARGSGGVWGRGDFFGRVMYTSQHLG